MKNGTGNPGKRAKTNITAIKPKATKPTEGITRLVLDALADWARWAPDTVRGLLTPVQFLAVVLWMLQTEKTTPGDDFLIVEGWARALLKAVRLGLVTAVHPITLLPIDATSDTSEWVLSVNHANAFLESMPIGFDCCVALEHFRGEALRLAVRSEEGMTFEKAALERETQKGKPWTDAQKAAVLGKINEIGYPQTAQKLGMAVQTLRNVVPGGRSLRGPGAKPGVGTANLGPWAALGGRDASAH